MNFVAEKQENLNQLAFLVGHGATGLRSCNPAVQSSADQPLPHPAAQRSTIQLRAALHHTFCPICHEPTVRTSSNTQNQLSLLQCMVFLVCCSVLLFASGFLLYTAPARVAALSEATSYSTLCLNGELQHIQLAYLLNGNKYLK